MALPDNYSTLVSDAATAYREKMEAAFNLTANAQYQASELQKAGVVIGELFSEIVMPYIIANAELQAALNNTGVTVSLATGDGDVDNGSVSGTIE